MEMRCLCFLKEVEDLMRKLKLKGGFLCLCFYVREREKESGEYKMLTAFHVI